jgi:WD40 repeat protein
MMARRVLFFALLVGVAASTADAAGRRPRFDLRAKSGPVLHVAFCPDGKLVAAAYSDERIRIWELASRSIVREFSVRVASAGGRAATARESARIEGLAYSPDGRLLAEAFGRGTASGVLRLWDAATGERLKVVDDGLGNLRCVAFSPDAALIATNMPDRERGGHMVALRSVATGEIVLQLRGERLAVSTLAFRPDGEQLVTAGGARACLWELAAQRLVRTLQGHKDAIQAVAFSPDGKTIATGGADDRIFLWNVEDGAKLHEIDAKSDGVTALVFTPSGRSVATGGTDRSVRLWSTQTGRLREGLFWHRDRVTSLAISPDGKTLASASRDESIAIWDVEEPDVEPPVPEDEEEQKDQQPAGRGRPK